MGFISKSRRVLMAAPETTSRGSGTPTLTAASDAVPLLRSATWTPKPIRLERPTLRLTMTGMPDTFPGVATVELVVTVELSGLPANPKTNYDTPNWVDLFRMCGFEEVSNQGSPSTPGGSPQVRNPRMLYNFAMTGTAPAGTPIRHGGALAGNVGGATGFAIGDAYAEDDYLLVEEIVAAAATAWTQTNSDGTRIATGTRDVNRCVALRLNSNINTTETGVVNLWTDGKLVKTKGVMGNFEIQLNHGDMIVAQFTLSGVLVSPVSSAGYTDLTSGSLGTPNELHKVPPTFLGKDLRLQYYDTAATATRTYGKDTGASILIGSLNKLSIASGNQVVLRENSLDPNGVSFAIITGRKPTGSFNPDEVFNLTPDFFDFMSRFVAGAPLRLRAMIGNCFGAGTTPLTGDGNTIHIIAPGSVLQSMGDGERDSIMAWDGQFNCSGGDYDPSAAGETPGADNELTIIYV